MTLPNYSGSTPSISGTQGKISTMSGDDQDTVVNYLKGQHYPTGGGAPSWWTGLQDFGSKVWGAINGVASIIEGIGGTVATDISDTILTIMHGLSGAEQNLAKFITAVFNGATLSSVEHAVVSDVESALHILTKDVQAALQVGGKAWTAVQKAAANITTAVEQTAETAWDDLEHLGAAVGNAVGAIVSGAQATIDGIVQGLTGWLTGGWTADDAKSSAASLAKQQADTAAAVAQLQQLNSGYAQSGNSSFVDFTQRDDATSMGSDFDQAYSGTGSALLGISGGRAAFDVTNDTASRNAYFTYNAMETQGDYQRVSMVFGSAPGKRNYYYFTTLTHVYGYNYIRARVAESGTYAGIDCVAIVFSISGFDIGCVVNGVWTTWQSYDHDFQVGAIYSLDAGGAGGDRQYHVLLNGANLVTYNEVGTSSNLGSGYRRAGGISESSVGNSGSGGGGALYYAPPGAIAAFYVADNEAPTMLSSIGRAFATGSTASFSTASTVTSFPDDWWNEVDYKTSDLEFDTTSGTWTVSKKGNYHVSAQVTATSTSKSGVLLLQKNGGNAAWGSGGVASVLSTTIPCDPGDEFVLLYFPYTASTVIDSDTAGAYTFFSVARITPDTLEEAS